MVIITAVMEVEESWCNAEAVFEVGDDDAIEQEVVDHPKLSTINIEADTAYSELIDYEKQGVFQKHLQHNIIALFKKRAPKILQQFIIYLSFLSRYNGIQKRNLLVLRLNYGLSILL